MIRSMTAYGRAMKQVSIGEWIVEIHSVNRKFLDISINLPREYLSFDVEIRKSISEEITRGQVFVKISLYYKGVSSERQNLNIEELKALKGLLEKTANDLGYKSKDVISFPLLLEKVGAYSCKRDEKKENQIKKDLLKALKEALKQCIKMKETEGKTLLVSLKEYLNVFEESLKSIAKRASISAKKFEEKLMKKLEDIKLFSEVDHKERLIREILVFAEKTDITEEIDRLTSHILQFRSLFLSEEKSVGRTMDFLIQEMQRETNTIAAKVEDIVVSETIIKMKSSLEKIREQVQNIE